MPRLLAAGIAEARLPILYYCGMNLAIIVLHHKDMFLLKKIILERSHEPDFRQDRETG